ncbi:MAG: BTAD domain-containing putative transcriptional regulator, partial [Gemmatimonadaceae bacterium]
GTFWPEHSQARARAALRSALYTTRRHLPEGMILSRGDDELSVNAEMIGTDVAAMADDIAAARYQQALGYYRGELMPGLYVSESQAFEKWLSLERQRVCTMARKAAALLSVRLEKERDFDGAIDAARKAAELDPDDEAAARRWIALLDRAGDRAQAFAVYERFRNHMSDAFGVRPSAETVALLDAVRTRKELSPTAADATSAVTHDSSGTNSADPPVATLPQKPMPVATNRLDLKRFSWIAAPVILAVLGWIAIRPEPEAVASTAARSLVVLPMLNQTGDPRLAYLATGIADGVARRLEGIGGIKVRSGARSDWSTTTRRDLRVIGREFGSTILLKSSISRAGDSLEVRASVVDASTFEERAIAAHRFTMTGISDAESQLAAEIAGAVFRVPMIAPQRSGRPIDPESHRLTLEGFHQFDTRRQPRTPGTPSGVDSARNLFSRAVSIDPMNARAWAGLTSVWGSRTVGDALPFDEGYERTSAAAMRALAIDSLQGTAWASLALMRALKYRDLGIGMELMRKAEAAEPSNAEVFLIKETLLRNAHLFDEARDAARVARRLDPLASLYVETEAAVELCADRPAAALQLYESELAMNPSDGLSQKGLTRTLARLGRYDEAIASWRREAATAGDVELQNALAEAKGKEGYWTLKHAEGRKRLDRLVRAGGRVSPMALVWATFASGDEDGGYVAIDKAAAAGTRSLYGIRCAPAFDEFRNTPRFAATVARIGALRAR